MYMYTVHVLYIYLCIVLYVCTCICMCAICLYILAYCSCLLYMYTYTVHVLYIYMCMYIDLIYTLCGAYCVFPCSQSVTGFVEDARANVEDNVTKAYQVLNYMYLYVLTYCETHRLYVHEERLKNIF